MPDPGSRTNSDGRVQRRVLLPVAVAAKADRLAGGSQIEVFSALVNKLVEEKAKSTRQ